MKKRGIIFIFSSIPPWAYAWVFGTRFADKVRGTPFAYELGSVAMPFPQSVRVASLLAIILTVIGIGLLVYDFIQWVKNKLHDAAS